MNKGVYSKAEKEENWKFFFKSKFTGRLGRILKPLNNGKHILVAKLNSFFILEVKEDFTKGKEIEVKASDLETGNYLDVIPTKDNKKIIALVDIGNASPAKIATYSLDLSGNLKVELEKQSEIWHNGRSLFLTLCDKQEYAFVLVGGNDYKPERIKVFSIIPGGDFKIIDDIFFETTQISVAGAFCFSGYFGNSGVISLIDGDFGVSSFEFCYEEKVIFEAEKLRKKDEIKGPVCKVFRDGEGKLLVVNNFNQRLCFEYKV